MALRRTTLMQENFGLPQELWDRITWHLSSLSAFQTASVLGICLEKPGKLNHGRIWSKIFVNDTWASRAMEMDVNLVLLGSRLKDTFADINVGEPGAIYVVLYFTDRTERFTEYNRRNPASFFDCLVAHEYNEASQEIVFKDGSILNMANVFCQSDWAQIKPNPTRLFPVETEILQSFYVFWYDEDFALRIFEPEDIVGVDGKATSFDQVTLICGLQMTFPNGHRVQATYQSSTLDDEENKTGFKVTRLYEHRSFLGERRDEPTPGWKLERESVGFIS